MQDRVHYKMAACEKARVRPNASMQSRMMRGVLSSTVMCWLPPSNMDPAFPLEEIIGKKGLEKGGESRGDREQEGKVGARREKGKRRWRRGC